MFEVDVVQFMRPDGRQVECKTDLIDEVKADYEAMVAAGYRFKAECLTTGEVSVTITNKERGDVDIRVLHNGPRVQEAMATMLHNREWEKP
mgnify:FL=1